MHHVLVFMVMMVLVGAAAGQDLGIRGPASEVPTKGDAHVDPQEGDNPRQGGDTIADATPIDGVPFSDSGTTAGYNNDYDEECPYGGSTAPDAVPLTGVF